MSSLSTLLTRDSETQDLSFYPKSRLLRQDVVVFCQRTSSLLDVTPNADFVTSLAASSCSYLSAPRKSVFVQVSDGRRRRADRVNTNECGSPRRTNTRCCCNMSHISYLFTKKLYAFSLMLSLQLRRSRLQSRLHYVDWAFQVIYSHGRRPTPKSGGDQIGKLLVQKT